MIKATSVNKIVSQSNNAYNNIPKLHIYRKTIPKLEKVITKCSNPLMQHSEECIILWNELEKMTDVIEEINYSLKIKDNIYMNNNKQLLNDSFKLNICDDPANKYLEECRIFEL